MVADGTGLLVAAQSGDQAELVVTNREGSLYRVLARTDAALAFAWSPDGNQVAYVARNRGESGLQGNLAVVDLEARGAEPHMLTEDTFVLGFFWSPDSNKIAYFVPGTYVNPEDETQQTIFLTLHVHNLRKQSSARFIASSLLRSSWQWSSSPISSISRPASGRRTAATSCTRRSRSRGPASLWRRPTAISPPAGSPTA